MPVTIKWSVQKSNVYRAPGIMSSHTVLCGRRSSCRHAPQATGRPEFTNELAQIKVLRNHGSFTGVGRAPDAKPAPPGAAGSIVDQTRLKPCWKRPFGLHNELEPEVKMEIPVIQAIVSGILGLGWLTTAGAWARDHTAAKQKIMDFLMEKRRELDDRPELLTVLGLLKQELEARRQHRTVPKIPDGLSGQKLRDLPGFLEQVGTFLEYNPATFRKAYGFFSEEVLLCAESSLLWEGEARYDNSVYWRSFNKFVTATRKRGYVL